MKQESAEEIVITPVKNLKMEHYRISKLLNDSTLKKFERKKLVEVNYLSGDQHHASKNFNIKVKFM